MGVSYERVDKSYNLGLRGPKPPGGPQGAQEPKSAPQKWASRARVATKTRKIRKISENLKDTRKNRPTATVAGAWSDVCVGLCKIDSDGNAKKAYPLRSLAVARLGHPAVVPR